MPRTMEGEEEAIKTGEKINNLHIRWGGGGG